MKKLLIPGVFSLAVLGTNSAAQEPQPSRPSTRPMIATATMGMPLPLPTAVEVEIKQQPDSPLQISVDEAVKGRLPGTPLKVRNDKGNAIAGYVLRIDVEPLGLNQMVVLGPRGLAVGESRIQALPMSNYREGSGKPLVSVDYVQFMDGRSWGEDSLGRSKHLAAYLKGRNQALAKLQEMLAGQDAADINQAFEVFGSSSFGEPNLTPPGRPPRYIDYAARGFEEVINILRRVPRSTELARDLARRLEATRISDQE
jgi:hypothetical protein